MRILDINGNEIVPGDRAVFTLNSDLCEGRILSFAGRYAPTAQIELDNGRTVKKLKLSAYADRRAVTVTAGEEFFKTTRMRLLSSPQKDQETSKNSLQVETQAAEKNSQEAWVETCQVCNGAGETKQGPWQAWTGRCMYCRGTGEWLAPVECYPRHGTLSEALSCDLCQCAARSITRYRSASKAVNHRGTEKNPCENWGATKRD